MEMDALKNMTPNELTSLWRSLPESSCEPPLCIRDAVELATAIARKRAEIRELEALLRKNMSDGVAAIHRNWTIAEIQGAMKEQNQ